MGIGVIVHGFIECPGQRWDVSDKRIYKHNRRVLDSLPLEDDWPYLCRQMFSALPMRSKDGLVGIPQYENSVIHFAGDFKDMYRPEQEWLDKFEARLLARLCWFRAEVYSTWMDARLIWETDIGEVVKRYQQIPPRPPETWSFKCLKRTEEEVAPSHVLGRSFSSRYHVRESPPS